MANITTTGTTGYPGTIDTRTALTDGTNGDQIVANHPNGLGAAVLAIENELGTDPAGSAVDVVTRLDQATNSDGTILSSVITAGPGSEVTYSSGVFTISGTPEGPGAMQNVAVEITPNRGVANQLGIRLVQRDGSTPTSASPGRLSFHAATSTSPGYQIAVATSNTELLLTSGSSLNFAANETGRMYIWAVLATPTVELGVSRYATFQEMLLQNTTAEGGAGGADSDNVLYTTTARTSVPVRCLGYIDITTGGTAGQWPNAPSFGSLVGPGSKRTGDTIQHVATVTGQGMSGTTVLPVDGSIPLNTEGDMYLFLPFTASSAVNRLVFNANLMISNGTVGEVAIALFGASNTAICAVVNNGGGADILEVLPLAWSTLTSQVYGAGTASVTYALRAGGSGAGTTRINTNVGGDTEGGTWASYLTITEIMV